MVLKKVIRVAYGFAEGTSVKDKTFEDGDTPIDNIHNALYPYSFVSGTNWCRGAYDRLYDIAEGEKVEVRGYGERISTSGPFTFGNLIVSHSYFEGTPEENVQEVDRIIRESGLVKLSSTEKSKS